MVDPSKPRAHGQTAGEEEAHEKVRDLDKPVELETEQPVSLTRAFQKVRTDWQGKDRDTMRSIKDDVSQFIFDQFQDAFEIEYQIWNIVREKVVDKTTGEVLKAPDGLDLWATRPDGSYIEDWSKIGTKEREALLYQIITRLFTWEQTAAEIRGEALFAKAIWEEAFAYSFDKAPGEKKTVEARNAVATRVTFDHRFLAVYKAVANDKAQAIVRSMDRICQRLKDLHT